jgi:hypothetical protein
MPRGDCSQVSLPASTSRIPIPLAPDVTAGHRRHGKGLKAMYQERNESSSRAKSGGGISIRFQQGEIPAVGGNDKWQGLKPRSVLRLLRPG